MVVKLLYLVSNNLGNWCKVKFCEYGCIWWININNYVLFVVLFNSNIRIEVGDLFMGFI